MKVSSPVGEFPFEAKRLRVERGRMVMEGSMGAWPAKVEIEPKDLLMMARLIPWPVFAGAAVALAGLLARQRGGPEA